MENDENNQKNEYNHLIILGNGFDLKCGLKTTYEEFFDERFGIKEFYKVYKNLKDEYYEIVRDIFKKKLTLNIMAKNDLKYFADEKNIEELINNSFDDTVETIRCLHPVPKKNLQLDSKGKYSDLIIRRPYNKWDMTFLFTFVLLTSNSIISWNDVETFIYLIVTWILQDYEKIRSKYYNTVDFSRLNRELERPFFELFKNCGFRKLDPKNLQDSSNSQEFDKNSAARNLHLIIEDIFLSRNKNINEKNKDSIAISMLQSLNEFERNFSTFILEQIRNKESSVPTYEKAASDLLSSIIQPHINSLYKHISNKNTLPKVNLDILNFNYSLNQTNISKIKSNQSTIMDLKINSFTNIHGVASDNTKNIGNYNWPAPIFGVDSHDILGSNNISFDDPRIIFTKSFRLLDNHINDIRKFNFQGKVNVITFFGHSLSHADYSYFESIFDKYHIYDSSVKLEFYYYPGNVKKNAKQEDIQAEEKRQERKTMKNVVKLLTTYGETVPNVHGENIVNKLMLEQRLSVQPYPEI